jgi:hypothetical protein
VIKFVIDLQQVGGFLRVLRFPPPIKLTEVLLKVALNTINQTIPNYTIYLVILVGLKGVRLSDTVDMEDCSLSEYLSTVSSAKHVFTSVRTSFGRLSVSIPYFSRTSGMRMSLI